ncbi:MAG: VOC family protein [Sandaracinaceae bacterium]
MTTTPTPQMLVPRLVVPDAAAALDWYARALGASERERHTAPSGLVVEALISVRGAAVSVVDEKPEWGNVAPSSLGGSAVLLRLHVDDADAAGAQMVENGATIVVPIADRFYGFREGRLQDPFGHLWILSQHLEDVSAEEIQRGLEGM